jgi:hypothetical protein
MMTGIAAAPVGFDQGKNNPSIQVGHEDVESDNRRAQLFCSRKPSLPFEANLRI